MKHILNNISEEEKNAIREQHQRWKRSNYLEQNFLKFHWPKINFGCRTRKNVLFRQKTSLERIQLLQGVGV